MKRINTSFPPLSSQDCPALNLLFIHLCRLEHTVSIFAICLYSALDKQDPLCTDLQPPAIQLVSELDFTTGVKAVSVAAVLTATKMHV